MERVSAEKDGDGCRKRGQRDEQRCERCVSAGDLAERRMRDGTQNSHTQIQFGCPARLRYDLGLFRRRQAKPSLFGFRAGQLRVVYRSDGKNRLLKGRHFRGRGIFHQDRSGILSIGERQVFLRLDRRDGMDA